jgi:NADPH2:quinone reductase
MMIRLFKQRGIKTINTVRQDKYIDELKKEGADYVLNSESPDFETQLKEIAAREGATLGFDAINGDFTTKILNCQPPNSICYAYGALSENMKWTIAANKKFDDGKTIAGLICTTYDMYKSLKREEILRSCMKRFIHL